MSRIALRLLALSCVLAIACAEGGASTTGGATAPAASSVAAQKPSGSASAAAAPSAVASTSAAPAGSASAATIVGGYSGPFDAKKKKMKLPPGASEPFWGLDKGKSNVGKGEVKLSVWSDGRVTGTVTGPLGDLDVEGLSEDGALTGNLTPKEPGGFRGTIAGKIEGGKFVGRLEASSRDVTIVREGALALDKI